MAQQTRAAELEHRKREAVATAVRVGMPLAVAARYFGVTLPPPAFGSATPPGRQEPVPSESPSASPVATSGPSAGPFGRFFGAIVEGDDRAFPAIAQAIMSLPDGMGGKILDGFATDPNTLAVIRGQIEAGGAREYFGELFIDGSDAFFGRFAEWWRAQNAGQDGAS